MLKGRREAVKSDLIYIDSPETAVYNGEKVITLR
jgi:hypothetical protein